MRYIFIVILICFKLILSGQKLTVDESDFFYQIAPVYDFKQSIVSLTFDDGYENQFTVGMPILKDRNMPATFYLITDRIDSLTKSLICNNLTNIFEIGSHTATHHDLVKIGNAEAKKELSDSKAFLQENFGINAGLTMSYPGGIYNNSVKQIVKGMFFAARSSDPGYNSLNILDRFAIRTQSFDMNTKANRANQWVDYAIQNHLWLVEKIHGINNTGYSPVDSKVLIEHLDYIKATEDNIWVATISDVIKYIDESKSTKIECELCNDTVYKIRINDFMDDIVYNQPLSIKIKIPANWENISIASLNDFKTENLNNSKFILFNALPDNQQITIRPKSISAPKKETGFRLVYLSANPLFDNVRLSLEIFDTKDIDIVLCDINGKLLIQQKEKAVSGVVDLNFDTSGLSKGMYFLRVSNKGGDLVIKRLVKI
jgi:beta-galactosidase